MVGENEGCPTCAIMSYLLLKKTNPFKDAASAPEVAAENCEYHDEVCSYLVAAHSGNMEALLLLEGDLAGRARKVLSEVNEILTRLLNIRATVEEVFGPLKKALRKELSALVAAKSDCLFKNRDARCNIVYSDITYTTTQIIMAIMEAVTDKEKKSKIGTLVKGLLEPVQSGNGTAQREFRVRHIGNPLTAGTLPDKPLTSQRFRMINSPLFAVASLLFTSDVASAPAVASENCELDLEVCAHLTAAHSGNADALLLLKNDLEGLPGPVQPGASTSQRDIDVRQIGKQVLEIIGKQ
ncbi:hypothetical protein Q1695_004317 [Nippostrongylus brasiliensis]|nr:hypothetical protein Q1695_004317 [Nippostrongylus brasiliensis]